MLVFLFLICNFFGNSDEIYKLMTNLDKLIKDTKELNGLYEINKNNGYYIFETSQEKFTGEDFKMLHTMITSDDSLHDCDDYKIYINELEYDYNYGQCVDYRIFFDDIEKIFQKKTIPESFSSHDDSKKYDNNKIHSIKKDFLGSFNTDCPMKSFFDKYISSEANVFIFSNSEIDIHLMTLVYRTIYKSANITGYKLSNSFIVFLSLKFKNEDDKFKFKDKINSMEVVKQSAKAEKLLENYGLFGAFSKKADYVTFDITTLFGSQKYSDKIKDELNKFSRGLEMFTFKKNDSDTTISKRVKFSIKKSTYKICYAFFNENEPCKKMTNYELINDKPARRSGIKKLIVKIEENESKWRKNEKERSHEIKINVFLSGEDDFTDSDDIRAIGREVLNLKCKNIGEDDENIYIPKYRYMIDPDNITRDIILFEHLGDIVDFYIDEGLIQHEEDMSSLPSRCFQNDLTLVALRPFKFNYKYKKSMRIKDAIQNLREKSLESSKKFLNIFIVHFYTFNGVFTRIGWEKRKKIRDKKQFESLLRHDLPKITHESKKTDQDVFFENPEASLEKVWIHFNFSDIYIKYFKLEFNKKIIKIIEEIPFCTSEKDKLDLKLFLSNESENKVEKLREQLLEFFEAKNIHNIVFINSPEFMREVGSCDSELIECFSNNFKSVIDTDCLETEKKRETIKWLRKLITQCYNETQDELEKNEYEDLEIIVSMFTYELREPEYLYRIKEDILSDNE